LARRGSPLRNPVDDDLPAYLYEWLEKAGFALTFGEDDTGITMMSLRGGGGYYIDVGAADLIANGDIKIACGQVSHLTEGAVVLSDGITLPSTSWCTAPATSP
jgi:putative flavoprotein involved in K+ transport